MWTRRTTLGLAPALAHALLVLAAPRAGHAQAAGSAPRLALKGYDPVAYFTANAPTAGRPEFELLHDGVLYRFASAQNRDLFKADPDRYMPQFGGACANNMANGQRRESDPKVWLIADGKLYVFAGAAGAENFRKDTRTAALRAAENWKTLKTVGD